MAKNMYQKREERRQKKLETSDENKNTQKISCLITINLSS